MASSSENNVPAAAASSSKIRMIVLRSSDGETFELEEAAARMSETVKNMIEDGCAGDVIPLPNVDSATLSKVAQYCKRLAPSAASSPEPNDGGESLSLEVFEAQFMSDVKDDKPRLFELILVIQLSLSDPRFKSQIDRILHHWLIQAANYLAIKELMDLACRTAAGIMKAMSVEEIRDFFNVVNDYTPEDEEKIRGEHRWAFQ